MNRISIVVKRNIEKIVNRIVELLGIEVKKNQILVMVQFVLFCMVGFSSAIVMYITYLILLYLTKSIFVANTVAFLTSTSNSFLWNRVLVFDVQQRKVSVLVMYVKNMISYMFTGLFLSNILLYLWVNVCAFSNLIAPVINIIILTPINFILNKIWTFSPKADKSKML